MLSEAPQKHNFKKPHSKDFRKGRYSLNGGIYLVTFATKKRDLIFKDFNLARVIVRCLNNSPYAETLAFVVMPNHVHWLIQLRSNKSISQTVQATKTICTKSINMRIGGKGTIWQSGFHDHAVRHEGAIREIARYIVANPIRAKLVKSVGKYPHWDAVWI